MFGIGNPFNNSQNSIKRNSVLSVCIKRRENETAGWKRSRFWHVYCVWIILYKYTKRIYALNGNEKRETDCMETGYRPPASDECQPTQKKKMKIESLNMVECGLHGFVQNCF